MLPAETFEKLKLVGFAVNCPAGVVEPVPVSETVVVGFVGSLLVIVMLPGTAPAAVGVKVTDTGTDCPALIVFGVATPLIPNSAPLKVITETVRSDEPLFPMEKVDVPFDPIVTVPKSSAEGVRVICC